MAGTTGACGGREREIRCEGGVDDAGGAIGVSRVIAGGTERGTLAALSDGIEVELGLANGALRSAGTAETGRSTRHTGAIRGHEVVITTLHAVGGVGTDVTASNARSTGVHANVPIVFVVAHIARACTGTGSALQ